MNQTSLALSDENFSFIDSLDTSETSNESLIDFFEKHSRYLPLNELCTDGGVASYETEPKLSDLKWDKEYSKKGRFWVTFTEVFRIQCCNMQDTKQKHGLVYFEYQKDQKKILFHISAVQREYDPEEF